jgi:hypothetical protein
LKARIFACLVEKIKIQFQNMKQELNYPARRLVAAISPNCYYIALTKIISRIKYARKILAA